MKTEADKLERAAVRARKALAVLERAFARWRSSKRLARLSDEERGRALDAWVLTLGEARSAHDRACAAAIAARGKS